MTDHIVDAPVSVLWDRFILPALQSYYPELTEELAIEMVDWCNYRDDIPVEYMGQLAAATETSVELWETLNDQWAEWLVRGF